jgi:hypothetical protein
MLEREVEEAVADFLAFLRCKPGNEEAEIPALLGHLDRLDQLGRRAQPIDQPSQPDPPSSPYPELLAHSQQRFPWLSLYNTPSIVAHSPGEAELTVGDPHDDLADLRGDLEQVSWCFQHSSPAAALWLFEFGWRYHWGFHLNDLRWYLFHYLNEPPAA